MNITFEELRRIKHALPHGSIHRIANDLALAGYPVTLLDQHPLPLHALLSEVESSRLLTAWEDIPLRFIGGVRVGHVSKTGAVSTVHTEGGQCFDTEHIVSAIGLQTPSRLARSAGLTWDNGTQLAIGFTSN